MDHTKQELNVGGSAAGMAQVAGTANRVTAAGTLSSGTPPEVLQALAAIQVALSSHPATSALAEAAVQQAQAQVPSKAAIGSQLKAAFDIAKEATGWVELSEKIAPLAKIVAAWLGSEGAAIVGAFTSAL